jgi:hypothetical protein
VPEELKRQQQQQQLKQKRWLGNATGLRNTVVDVKERKQQQKEHNSCWPMQRPNVQHMKRWCAKNMSEQLGKKDEKRRRQNVQQLWLRWNSKRKRSESKGRASWVWRRDPLLSMKIFCCGRMELPKSCGSNWTRLRMQRCHKAQLLWATQCQRRQLQPMTQVPLCLEA